MMRSGITWRRRKEVVMNDEVEMQTVEERIPALEGRKMFRWPRFLLESVLAIGGSLAVTGFISLFQLYPKIPNFL